MVAKGAMARLVFERRPGELTRRVVSAVLLAPPVLAAVHYGSPFFEILVAAAAVVMAWEWDRLCGGRVIGVEAVLLAVVFLTALAVTSVGRPVVATAILVPGTAVIAAYSFFASKGERAEGIAGAAKRPLWLGTGGLYLGLASVAFLWLGTGGTSGRETIFWLLAVVWSVDIGAFLCGRLIGGPRLAPVTSPGKTWAGLIGGVTGAGMAGATTATVLGQDGFGPLAAASAAVGIVAQAGDLAESWVKRKFGVKDSGNVIPGHGGLLDRVDGLLAASAVVALIGIMKDGEILTWM